MNLFSAITQAQAIIVATSVFVLTLIALITSTISLFKAKSLNKKLSILLSGKEAKDLETVILGQAKAIKDMDKEIQDLFEISNQIHLLAQRGLHKVGMIRFNPFKDVGGNQSFALALMDGQNSGVVITSLHTREGNHVYLKPITKGVSPNHPLTEEEKKAVKMANPSKNIQV